MQFKLSKPLKTTLEWVAIVGLIVVISLWLNRHLLDKGTELPPLSLPDLQGNMQQIDWHDSRRTLIYAFAPWCGVCRISMPGLNLIQHDDVRVIVLAFDWQNTEEVSQFINDVGFQGQVLLANTSLAQILNVDAYPTYYVVDDMGIIRHHDRGVSTPPGLWLRTRL